MLVGRVEGIPAVEADVCMDQRRDPFDVAVEDNLAEVTEVTNGASHGPRVPEGVTGFTTRPRAPSAREKPVYPRMCDISDNCLASTNRQAIPLGGD